MSERGEERHEEEGEFRRPSARTVGCGLLCLWALVFVVWFTSARTNVPLPTLLFQKDVSWLPEGTNLYNLYGHGWKSSLLRTYGTLLSPAAWRDSEIGWENVDWFGHAEALGAITLYTIIGVMALGTLRVCWPWMTRLAVGYGLGVGIAGWLFELWAIGDLLYRWTVLITLLVLLGALGWLCWAAWRRMEGLKPGEPELGAPFPKTWFDLGFRCAAWVLLALLVSLSFFHAVAFPPTNWDGLILYLGYARQTHELGGFPVKVVAQVGIGLGANYPHLYEVTQSAITRLGGHWTSLVGQWAVPWASLASTVVVFALAHRLFRRRDLALAAALIFRCIPYNIAFSHLASNYPLAMLFTASILLAIYDWLSTGARRFAVLMLVLAAVACHVNYLMPALWAVVIGALVVRGLFDMTHVPERLPNRRGPPPRVWGGVLLAAVICLLVSATWYLRNWIVTGNPVYCFFHEFLDGRNINPEVLESANGEWLANGDGVRQGSLVANLLALPRFLLLEPATRWKLAPLFEALAVPGLAMVLGGVPIWRRWRLFESADRLLWWMLALVVFFGLWLYHLAVADFYLYQILPMLVPTALLATVPLTVSGGWGLSLRVLVVTAAVLIGVPFSLMGFKFKYERDQLSLHALRHPFIDRDSFYARVFPEDVVIWWELEDHWRRKRVLTHDNRHLILDPLVEVVHLDDWEVQAVYEIADPDEQLDFWENLGVDLYLHIAKESKHAVNARAGLQRLIDRGDLRLIRHSPLHEAALYAFPWTSGP